MRAELSSAGPGLCTTRADSRAVAAFSLRLRREARTCSQVRGILRVFGKGLCRPTIGVAANSRQISNGTARRSRRWCIFSARRNMALGAATCATGAGLFRSISAFRLAKCPFGTQKTTCRECPVHCYRPAERTAMKDVMRFAGPRMLWRHPFLALRHLWLERQGPPPWPPQKRKGRGSGTRALNPSTARDVTSALRGVGRRTRHRRHGRRRGRRGRYRRRRIAVRRQPGDELRSRRSCGRQLRCC